MKMDIVSCTDKQYVMPTAVMMLSVCVNNPKADIVFHIVVDESVTADDRHDMEEIVGPYEGKSVVFYPIDVSLFPRFPRTLFHITQASFYRLMLAEILPETINKVLYLDGDLIVRHSLIPLWKTPLRNHAIAAVTDWAEGRIEYYNRLRYPPALGYFNSGVLLINLKYWRELDVKSDFLEYMRTHEREIIIGDQDVLNVVFCEKKITLPIKYNLQHGYLSKRVWYDYWKYEQEVLDAINDPVIIHFTSPDKPWITCEDDINPYNSSFYKYQDQTKWKGVRYERRSSDHQKMKNHFFDIPPIDP